MHYRDGSEAHNGDKIVQIGIADGKIIDVGMLQHATPGIDYCNGNIVSSCGHETTACLCDCLPVAVIEQMIKDKGLDKRPAGM